MCHAQTGNRLSTSRLDHDTALPEEELTNYVGLLHLLSDEVMQRQREIKFNRILHAYSVLSEQQTQRKRRASCEKKLARISSMNSLEARERALHVAELFMKVDECDRYHKL